MLTIKAGDLRASQRASIAPIATTPLSHLTGRHLGALRRHEENALSGIGPTYSTNAARDGLRISDLYQDQDFFEQKLRKWKDQLRPYIVDAVDYMRVAQEKKRSVLVKGSQGLMLDIDYGTYPYVTSSHTGLGGCIQALTLNPFTIKNVIAVVKAYTTRVGGGPFLTELTDETGKKLQEIGGEIGVSTGRHRRCGWLDLVVLKYSTAVNHYTSTNLTKLDVLDTFPTIRVATAYITPDKEKLTSFPADLSLLEKCTVEYTDFEGWQSPTQGVRKWADLPPLAQKYIQFIESFIGVKITTIGTGQDREDMILCE
ncbi:P-loop containing nucleoside triphosphate hydrolase protein [Thozetella sp. PMI_491]|nr:P-loop containing nucleoside triphosphate hydrolase protein [Thozetella sp. PMI_491]